MDEKIMSETAYSGPVLTTFEIELSKLRKKVNKYIDWYLQEDCGHKSYEGTFEMTICFPNYFDDPEAEAGPDFYQLSLHCYVLGPNRHYEWKGKNWEQVFKEANRDIDSWIKAEM